MIGLIGGLGPLAGAHVYERLVALAPAATDQEHPPVVLLSLPFPSRIEYMRDGGTERSPLPMLREATRMLLELDCSVAALCSATTHAFLSALEQEFSIPFVDGVTATVHMVGHVERDRAMVLCTSAARHARLFEERWCSDKELLYPSDSTQASIDELVADVKAGRVGEDRRRVLARLVHRHAEARTAVVLGCTELPPLLARQPMHAACVSISDAIATAALEAVGVTPRGSERQTACA